MRGIPLSTTKASNEGEVLQGLIRRTMPRPVFFTNFSFWSVCPTLECRYYRVLLPLGVVVGDRGRKARPLLQLFYWSSG